MSTALNRFIEAGERRLADLDEPERTIVAAKLHNEMLRRFPGGIDANPDLEFDGKLIEAEPLNDKDVEDQIIEDHDEREDNVTASDMVEERDGDITGCYSDGGEEESDRGGFRFRPIPIDQKLKSSATSALKKVIAAAAEAAGFTPEEAKTAATKALDSGTQTFSEAPDLADVAGLEIGRASCRERVSSVV